MTSLPHWMKKRLEELGTDPLQGLTQLEAARRLAQCGKKARKHLIRKQLTQWMARGNGIAFALLLAAVLLFAVAASVRKGESPAGFIALAVLLLLGILLEAALILHRGRLLASLQRKATPNATVVRGGIQEKISSHKLVPGDLVVLNPGDCVPADLVLLENCALQILQEETPHNAQTTMGEGTSPAGSGARQNSGEYTVSSGSVVAYGHGRGVVVNRKSFDSAADNAKDINLKDWQRVGLPQRLCQAGIPPALVTCSISAVVLLAGLFSGVQCSDILLLSLALAISAAPGKIYSAVSAALALGARHMAKDDIFIRQLSVIEALSRVSIVCIDTLDLLREEGLAVGQIWAAGREPENAPGKLSPQALHLLRLGAICSNASGADGNVHDSIDTAISATAQQCGISAESLAQDYPKVMEELSSSSIQGCTKTVHRAGSRCMEMLKGDIGAVLPLCVDTDAARAMETYKAMRQSHEHVLAVARREHKQKQRPNSGGYTFMGLIAVLRSSGEADDEGVTTFRQAGIKIVLVTEKPASAAAAIARESGTLTERGRVITGAELSRMSQQQLERHLPRCQVFAGITTADKERIIKAMRHRGAVVAATGRSVWDVPALNAADIGFATGTPCAAASASADIAADGGLHALAQAVQQSRLACRNSRRSVLFLRSCLLGQEITILSSLILGFGCPLLAPHLLLLNLIICPVLTLSLGAEPELRRAAKATPASVKQKINPKESAAVLLYGIVLGIAGLSGFALGSSLSLTPYFSASPAAGVTACFWVMYFATIALANCLRSRFSLFRIGFFSSKAMVRGVCISMAVVAAIILFPFVERLFLLVELSMLHWIYLLLLSSVPLLAGELFKLLYALHQRYNERT